MIKPDKVCAYFNSFCDKIFNSLELVKLILGENVIPAGRHHSSHLAFRKVRPQLDSRRVRFRHTRAPSGQMPFLSPIPSTDVSTSVP